MSTLCKSNLYSRIEFINAIFSSFADLVLKDKIVVYDLAHQRIGWTNYDCKFATETLISCKECILSFTLLKFKIAARFVACKCLCDYEQGRVHQCKTVVEC